MLHILLGRAGSGKTHTCIQEAVEALRTEGPAGPPLVLLAPEQATLQLERAVLAQLPLGAATARLRVLSFARLAQAVLAERGGAARPRLGETGRRLVVWTLLHRLRGQLASLASGADLPGLAVAVADQLAELGAYRISPERLRQAAQAGPEPAARARLADLALLWEAYLEAVARGPADPGSELIAAASLVPGSTLERGRFWVDGFAGFTPSEEHLLGALVDAAQGVCVALCLDGAAWLHDRGALDASHPFAPTRRTLERLLGRHPQASLEVLPRAGAPTRFAPGGALWHLEASLWQGERGTSRAGPEEIFLHTAADPRAEAEAAADEMDRLCREEGFRFGEMAVIVRDMETYHDLVAGACARRGIPLFVDRRRPAARHPALAAPLAALEVVRGAWRLEDVRRYLGSELCGLDRHEADELENWALAQNLDARDWRSKGLVGLPTVRRGERQRAARHRLETARRLNALRARLAAGLRPLERLGALESGHRVAQALWDWLLAVGAPQRVQQWVEQARTGGHLEEAAWHRKCWEAVVGVLEELDLAVGDELLETAHLPALWRALVGDLTVGLVPPGLDQVLCGAVERSRHPELRVAFVLGVAEGSFPPAPREQALVNDEDRLHLRETGVELAPTATERLLSERYLGYIALTRARQRLYLSAPKAPGPADLFLRVQDVLGVEARAWPTPPEPTVRRGVTALAGALATELAAAARERRAPGPGWAEARQWLLASPERARICARALEGLEPRRSTPLPADLARQLYPARASASRLESMAACPFQHFGLYGLRLRTRAQGQVEPSHLGQLLHAALSLFTRGVLDEGRELGTMAPDEVAARGAAALERSWSEVFADVPRGAWARPLRQVASRDLAMALEALVAHARAGVFRTVAAEQPFCSTDGALQGRVDRVDEAHTADGVRAVRVVDYKTGGATFSLQRFYHGLDLQPALYLDTMVGPGELPAGLFVLTVRAETRIVPGPGSKPPGLPTLRGLAPEEEDLGRLHERELDGSVTGVRRRGDGTPWAGSDVASQPGFELLRRGVRRRCGQLAEQALRGVLSPAPYRLGTEEPCAHCDLLDVCGLDPPSGLGYRFLRREPDVWTRLAEEVARDG